MPSFNKWNLLSAMQALTVYILVRLQEGETPDNNHDVLLLSTLFVRLSHPSVHRATTDHLQIVACALNEQVNFGLCIARSGLYSGPDHHDWIFEESRRRLALVYQILKMLYSLDPATACTDPDGFLLAPLPAKKQLWEAPDAQNWMAETTRNEGHPIVFGVLTSGQMVKMQEQQIVMPGEVGATSGVGEEESARNWQEWCAGMDGLGALVTLATSLSAA